jgi:pimeloyl-ACP methyl ester carboxylesterase
MRTGEVMTNDGVRLHYVEEFSLTRHVVAYDHRGHGQSDHPRYGYRPEQNHQVHVMPVHQSHREARYCPGRGERNGLGRRRLPEQ